MLQTAVRWLSGAKPPQAGLVNTYFGRKYAPDYGLKKTSILVRPALLNYAASAGIAMLLLPAMESEAKAGSPQ